MLINGLNHRVKNTLATVQSLAAQTLRASSNSAEGLKLFEGRLMALSTAHNLLTLQHWQGVDIGEVVTNGLASFAGDGRCTCQGDTAILSPHLVERFFCKLKHFRSIATRFEKLTRNFLAAVALDSARLWICS